VRRCGRGGQLAHPAPRASGCSSRRRAVRDRCAAAAADAEEAEHEREYASKIADDKRGWRAAGASFLVLFTAEWGDLSQLLTAGLVAGGNPAVPVFIGSWLALIVVSGAAVLLGRVLLRYIRLSMVRYVAAGVCALLALVTLIGVIHG
jgi:putative Ca2+/H+ antiporter (TMEM165/GDT1 family)